MNDVQQLEALVPFLTIVALFAAMLNGAAKAVVYFNRDQSSAAKPGEKQVLLLELVGAGAVAVAALAAFIFIGLV